MLVTDHQPLMAILGSKKGLPTLAAAWLQRWAILLAAYQYDLEFRVTAQHCNADGFRGCLFQLARLEKTLQL